MAEEVPFLQRDRPWERATLIVAGTPTIPHQADQIVIASPLSTAAPATFIT